MPNTYTDRLRLVLQEEKGNLLTWDALANQMVELIDDAIAGIATVSMASGDVTLTTQNNLSDQARNAMIQATGTLTANRVINVPAVTKAYLVINDTSGAFTLTVKTAAGSGVEVTQGKMAIVICDGTNVVSDFEVALAANASNLGGVAAAAFAQLAVRNTYTKSQDVQGVDVAYSATIELDASLSNVFDIGALTGNLTLSNPTNTVHGQTIIVHLTQDGTGSHTVTFGSNWLFPGGSTGIASGANEKSSIYGTVDTDGFIRSAITQDYTV